MELHLEPPVTPSSVYGLDGECKQMSGTSSPCEADVMHDAKRIPRMLLIAIIAALATIGLAGCSASAHSPEPAPSEAEVPAQPQMQFAVPHDRFYATASDIDAWNIDDAYVIVDDETGVEYLYTWNSGGYAGGSAMTMLVNADGTPKINSLWALTHAREDAIEAADDEDVE